MGTVLDPLLAREDAAWSKVAQGQARKALSDLSLQRAIIRRRGALSLRMDKARAREGGFQSVLRELEGGEVVSWGVRGHCNQVYDHLQEVQASGHDGAHPTDDRWGAEVILQEVLAAG